ncbi:MAG: trypsin-like peptidase domain-containing protein [Ruminococcus sp.]|nr:trypsin-like peptidase domain-containing protein [Ruminococcus sp.]
MDEERTSVQESNIPSYQQPVQTANTNTSAPYNNYNPFMYEPVGISDFDKAAADAMKAAEERREKIIRKRRERGIFVLFALIFLISAALAVYGIAADISRGSGNIENLVPDEHIVLYQNSKPEGANDLENFVDDNGKYTTEGAAAAVKPSIVEIYTYGDSLKNELYGTGSGVILSADGYIVTNAHVLQADGYHTVHTVDGRILDAKIIGRDAKTDIAVIKVTGSNLTPAVLGDSDEVIVGEQVIAIGNPAGLSSSVTDGIVSAVSRKIKSDSTGFEMECIQTNAAISPGNSGGALVNMYGQVIGITSSKYVSSSYEGLGFAITINAVKPIIEELIDKGYMSGRFRIGITFTSMDKQSLIEAIEAEIDFDLPEDFTGIYITDISKDCDIYNTELEKGDFITEVDGQPVKNYSELYKVISENFKAGDKVPATCARITEDKKIEYYDIEFELMEDTSGNF